MCKNGVKLTTWVLARKKTCNTETWLADKEVITVGVWEQKQKTGLIGWIFSNSQIIGAKQGSQILRWMDFWKGITLKLNYSNKFKVELKLKFMFVKKSEYISLVFGVKHSTMTGALKC